MNVIKTAYFDRKNINICIGDRLVFEPMWSVIPLFCTVISETEVNWEEENSTFRTDLKYWSKYCSVV